MYNHLILKIITKSIVGLILLFGLYVQFHGDYSPGGGFQAGVIFAAGFILYGVVMGLERVQNVLPFGYVKKMSALGVLIYALTGVYSLLVGYSYLDYGALSPHHPEHGQHYGILIVELGVGITVAGVIMCIYYCFASRTPHLDDQEW